MLHHNMIFSTIPEIGQLQQNCKLTLRSSSGNLLSVLEAPLFGISDKGHIVEIDRPLRSIEAPPNCAGHCKKLLE